MSTPIGISERATGELRQLFDQLEQLPKSIQTYINALAAQLNIQTGWRFDPDSMTFVPPTSQVPIVPAESVQIDALEE